ncbi:hypothetical protein ABDB91_11120 [Desulfoscipio sp. XC116]|uniref:hypothetical protein n=1 Tax=Desulfoscipio sp. XC116 TaxID=3144975 RepID=UPI00325B0C75
MCLYEPDKRVLVSGDHILVDNNIEYFPDCARRGESPGGLLANLDKAYHMDIGLVLPGRRSLIHDVRKRINELKTPPPGKGRRDSDHIVARRC